MNRVIRSNFNGWNIFGKFVLDMGSLSHCGLIIAQGQDANRDNLEMYFRSSIKQWYVECSH